MFFTEQAADAIGVAARLADGHEARRGATSTAAASSRSASRSTPTATSGSREGSSNRLGRMTLDPTAPFSADGHSIAALQHPERRLRGRRPASRRTATRRARSRPARCRRSRCRTRRSRRCRTASPSTARAASGTRARRARRVGYLDPAKAEHEHDEGLHGHARPGQRVRPLAGARRPRDRRRRHRLLLRRVRRPDRLGDGRRRRADPREVRLPPDRAQQPHRLAADRPAGNLWFLEGGREPRSRASRASPPACRCRPASPLLVANTATGRVTGSGLSTEISSLDVRVIRGATVVAHADGVPVQGRSFDTTVPLRADDRIEFVPHGAHPPATFSFRVANLAAGASAGGRVAGSALTGTSPLADDVTIDAAGRHGDGEDLRRRRELLVGAARPRAAPCRGPPATSARGSAR